MFRSQILKVSLFAGMLIGAAMPAGATPFQISFNTASLVNPDPAAEPLTVAFGFSDGNAATNTVTLSNFDFGGGSAVAGTADCTLGGLLTGTGCGGDLGTAMTLTDQDFVASGDTLAFFSQQFKPGTTLSFNLDASHAADPAGPFLDGFSV